MAFKPTAEQEKAINAVGNTLVSAAAGSGKTAVLVERVITALTNKEKPISADKLLIVTFTNAAANEMRSRIEKRLREECVAHPDDISLTLQCHLLNNAKICTIDSFCIDLVRENFDKLNIPPDFKIGEGTSLNSINERVATNIVNRYLRESDKTFFELLDLIGTEEDEVNFVSLILQIYNKVQHLPFPNLFYKSLSDFYTNGVFSEDSIWAEYAFTTADSILESVYFNIQNALESFETYEDFYLKYAPSFKETLISVANLQQICSERDWDAFYNAFTQFSVAPIPAKTRNQAEPEEVEVAKNFLKSTPTLFSRITKLFYGNKEFINLQFKYIFKPLSLLSDILIELDGTIFEEYLKQNTLTFHNVEHLAFNLLCEEKNGEIIYKEDIQELIDNYDAVMVDEFQDVNDMQNLLFTILSDFGKNLFVVGDVKQSIYGFRGSNPNNFLAKKSDCVEYEIDDNTIAKKVILGRNFRCKPESCDFINYFFKLFMTDKTGVIDYNGEEELIPKAEFPEIDFPSVEIDIIDASDSSLDSVELEARRVAQYIKNTMNDGKVIAKDKTTLREAEYSDFAVLMRSPKTRAPIFAKVFKEYGIPVSYEVEDFTGNSEINLSLQLLSVIDNPHNDIALLNVLFSPIFCFTADELALMRSEKKDGSLYSSVFFAATMGNSKAKQFIDRIEKYRTLSVTMTLSNFVSYLLYDTDYIEMVSLLSDGERRRANLLLLISYAEQFYNEGCTSIGEFSKKLLKIKSDSLKAAGSSGGNSVKIMSIHKSKGLQFPVCIVSCLGSEFNTTHKKLSTLYTTDFGIGFKYYDEYLKEKLTTISYEAISDRITSLSYEEEMRLLYVAMTRTQDRLIFTSTVKDIEKYCNDLYYKLYYNGFRIDKYLLSRMNSFSDWIVSALMLHPLGKELRPVESKIIPFNTKSQFALKFFNESDFEDAVNIETEIAIPDQTIIDYAQEVLNYKYPYKDILELESKASVSKLANSAESAKYAFKNEPAFMSKGGLRANEKGTAMHKCMEYFDFSKANDIESELDRLYEYQFISENERDSINIEALKIFFSSDIFNRMVNSKEYKKEMRFLTEVDASVIAPELTENLCEEKIIVQGAVDVCFIEDDGIVILDFKTDRVTSPDELKSAYGEQLEFYAKACEKIFNLPVKEKIIYSFSLNAEIKL